jgi:hypothetical protein
MNYFRQFNKLEAPVDSSKTPCYQQILGYSQVGQYSSAKAPIISGIYNNNNNIAFNPKQVGVG